MLHIKAPTTHSQSSVVVAYYHICVIFSGAKQADIDPSIKLFKPRAIFSLKAVECSPGAINLNKPTAIT